MPHRNEYWSCSRFADFVRGTPKPNALPAAEWDKWSAEAKAKHPIRYWAAESALDSIQDTLNLPIDILWSVRYWLSNRYCSKTHTLTSSSLKKGQWHELSTRLLYCAFDELTNYVEQQLAWMQVISDDALRKKYPRTRRAFRMCNWRDAELGVQYLHWSSNLVADESWGINPGEPGYGELTGQAKSAREVLELYLWWIDRPIRPDAYDVSGWTALCAARRNKYGSIFAEETAEEKEETKKVHAMLNQIEEQYEAEDEEMLIRLIKIRQSLWT